MQLKPDVQVGLLMCQSVSQCVSPSVINFFWHVTGTVNHTILGVVFPLRNSNFNRISRQMAKSFQ